MNLPISDASQIMKSARDNLAQVIQGKEDKIELVVLALIASGHILIEDIPGIGKTTLARSLARTVDGSFNRVQFTPDLLPTDITGVNIFKQNEATFSFTPGPLFANIILADEINRASPRTQSALLEAMSEQQVTIDGTSHPLPAPFIVLATQNPVEYHGTYPLPEAQLDRFMLQIDLGYPPKEKEQNLIINRTTSDPVNEIDAVLGLEDLCALQNSVDQIRIEESVSEYLLEIVEATRNHPQLRLGVSTRGALLYARMVRSRAIFQERDYVIPEDIKQLAEPVLAHRILMETKAQYGGTTQVKIIQDIVESIKVPR